MRDPRIKRYIKKLPYSYALGVAPTMDLLTFRPEKVIKVLLESRGMKSDGVLQLIDTCKERGIAYEVMDRAIERISVKENTFAVGVFSKYEEELQEGVNHVVLDQPRDMGNIGTIVRTMAGFGVMDLAIIKPAVDIFDPMVVRSAMGALFLIRFKFFDSFKEYCERYTNTKYLFMLDGAKEIQETTFERPFSLVFGSESSGLPREYGEYGKSVYIKQSDKIDSLNLSIAAAIGIYVSSVK